MIAEGLNQVVISGKFMTRRKKEVKSFIGFIKSKMVPPISLPFKIQTAIDKREQRRLVQLQQPQLQQSVGGHGDDRHNNRRDNQNNDWCNKQLGRSGRAWWKQQPAGEFPAWDLKFRKNHFSNDDEGWHNVEIIQKIKAPHHKKDKTNKNERKPLCPKHLIGLECNPHCRFAHVNKKRLEGSPKLINLKNEIGQALSRIYNWIKSPKPISNHAQKLIQPSREWLVIYQQQSSVQSGGNNEGNINRQQRSSVCSGVPCNSNLQQ